MFFDVFDARDKALRPGLEDHEGAHRRDDRQIDIEFSQQGRGRADGSPAQNGGPECVYCRHRHCRVCEDCSAAKQYSDYWICHCCGELNLRDPNLQLTEVSHGLGKN